MRRIRAALAVATMSAAVWISVPSPAPAVKCSDALDEVCRAVCQVGQKLGFECLQGVQQG